jgi:uncharacterized protein (TIRG00374 family)
MSNQAKIAIRYALSGILTLFFVYVAFRGIDLEKFLSSLVKAHYLWILPMVVLIFISHLLRAWRWKFMMEHIKTDIALRNLFAAVMIGYMVNGLIPRAGELVRPYAIGRLEKTSASSAFATIVVERVVDILSLLVVFALSLLWFRGALMSSFPWLADTAIVAAVMIFFVIGFFLLFALRTEPMFRLVNWFTRMFPVRIAAKLESVMKSFLEGLLLIKNPTRYLAIIILSGAICLCYISILYVAFLGFDLTERYSLNFTSATVLYVVSTIGFIIPTPGGTGTYHTFCRETLTRMFNVDYEVALAYATLTHAVNYLFALVVGVGILLCGNLKLKDILKTRFD